MGLGIAFAGGVLLLTVVTAMFVLPSVMESITNLSESKTEIIKSQQNLGDTSLRIDNMIASQYNDEFVFLLTNTGNTKIWNFENLDMYLTYDGIVNGLTTKLTEPLTFEDISPTKVNCDGSVVGVAVDNWAFGTYTNDNLDPGILNPQETVQISGRVSNKFAVNGTGTLALTTDTGYFLNKSFDITNGTEDCAWYDINWNDRNKITINHAQVLANLTNFPVMFKLRDRDLKVNAQDDGDDFLFTADDKVTKLSHEIEYYDQTRGELTAWVKIPYLSSLEDTDVYLYYGNSAAANQENSTGVWTNGYKAVYHLHNDFVNSTDNKVATNVGTDSVTGEIANGADFENSQDDRINTGKWNVSGAGLTIQTWANLESYTETDARLISKASGTSTQNHVFMLGTANSGDDLTFNLKTGVDDLANTSTLTTNSAVTLNTWHFLAATYDGSNMKIYQNGVLQGTLAKTGSLRQNSWDLFIGATPTAGTTKNIDGILDEVRISSIARSIEWLKTEYNNIISPQTFYTFSPKEPFTIWADNGWLYRKKISINKDSIDADLSDFPVLVSITDSDLTKAQNDGNDVVFTSADGRVQLDTELEYIDNSVGKVAAWVRVPFLLDAKNTTLYMYYGQNSTASLENIPEVWDSNYKAVYHLKENQVTEKLNFEPTAMNSASVVQLDSSPTMFAIWAPRSSTNGGYIHTVDIDTDGSITGVVETQQFSGLGQVPDGIHINGDVYAVAYKGPSNHGWIATSEILSNGTVTDHAATRSTYGQLDAYQFESGSVNQVSITSVGSTHYAVAYSGPNNDLYVQTLDIPDDGALVTTIEASNNLDSDGYFPRIIPVGSTEYAIIYSDENNDGTIKTIDIDSSGNIGTVDDTWKYDASNGETPSIVNISGNVYGVAYKSTGSDGYVRTMNITSAGVITKAGYPSSASRAFDTNLGNYPELIQVFQTVYAIVYEGPSNDGYIKTVNIFPNGTVGNIIDTLHYDTINGQQPQIDQVATNIFAVAYSGASNNGYVATIPINNDGVIGETALDSTIYYNTGRHVNEPLGTTGKIAIGADLEKGNSNYIVVTDNNVLDITGSLTLSAWVLSENNNQAAWETILAKGDTAYRLHMCGTAASCAQGTTNDAFSFAMTGPTGTTDLGSNINPGKDEWHYVAGTYDGTTQKIYVDGALNQQQARSGNIGTNNVDLAIGENLGNAGRYWDGMVDEIRISNSARSADWIKAEYNNQNSPQTFMSFGPETQIN